MDSIELPGGYPDGQGDEEKFQHRHCNRSDVFWQDGVARCVTCGETYPPYEPVEIYASKHFMVSTYLNTASGEQRVILLTINDTEVQLKRLKR